MIRFSTLRGKIFTAFFAVILALGLSIFFLGYTLVEDNIVERAQQEVEHDLASARSFYQAEIQRIGEDLRLIEFDGNVEKVQQKIGLDYARYVDKNEAPQVQSEIVQAAFEKNEGVGGTRLIPNEELQSYDEQLVAEHSIAIKPTPMARPTTKEVTQKVMSKEYALPIRDADGDIEGVLYGGRIVNRDHALVDRIRYLVFGHESYEGKPVGTVTIFQDDVRISTNVVNEDGSRAIGTRVSDEVYSKVVEQGKVWHDRAFVVTDWYKTAYEPIETIEGEIVGILYVGILEAPFVDMARGIMGWFLVIVLCGTLFAGVLSYLMAGAVSRPLTHLLEGIENLSGGNLGYESPVRSSVVEINRLASSFNIMSVRLKERDESLKESNAKLEDLNQRYLELLGFVAHELKGMLASTIMNAYSIRDGFLGMINFKQKRAVDSITRNLDYLAATVKKFLNLSRIERGKLELNKSEFAIGPEVFDISVKTFDKLLSDKGMKVENKIDPEMKVSADLDLLQIVANNLISNAGKYGTEGGVIRIDARNEDNFTVVEVYNDGRPISQEAMGHLFKRFSRLDTPEKKTVKGTGLGLFITRQIVEAHGGDIKVVPGENGNTFVFRIERE
ncbi:Sensor protein CzcS precursor [Anaerohalosphaera lusitana]|uniref:histidine kinase n=1 Tax=Anaerohalosphaera lusitana TaxID=1936003 RepID=A0A1U9NK06_9BACT|nr:cache domain-containing protein [Anaerohalosphaera lusitana]AQT68273.1 Sensor protein CzcS precursor [Anaerohalosphaera lusitana]